MKDGVHVFWLRDEHRKPVTCVASKLDGDTVKYATATHNPHDAFCRATGRNKAIGRLNAVKQPATAIRLNEGEDPKKMVLYHISVDPKVGPLTRKVASLAALKLQ